MVELCQASEKSCRILRREAPTQADRALRVAPDFALAYAMRANCAVLPWATATLARYRAAAQHLNEKARTDFDSAVRVSGDRLFYLAARADYLIGRAAMLDPAAADPLPSSRRPPTPTWRVKGDPKCACCLVAEANAGGSGTAARRACVMY